MTKTTFPAIALFTAFILSGCEIQNSNDNKSASGAKAPEGTVAATVNGQPITEETLKLISDFNRNPSMGRDKVLENLINQELLAQEAISKHLDEKPEVAQKLYYVQRSILSQAAVSDYINSSAVSDADIQKEYEQTYGGAEQKDYQARHILTDSEDKAKEIIQKLKEGAKFDELAKEHSTDPTTRSKGGDLGWFSPEHMVKPFSEAVVALADGDYTLVPVKTQFGWHVIIRDGSRAKTPPPLDSVKASIQSRLQHKAAENYLETLKKNAKIEIVPPKPAEPAPMTPAPAAPQAGPSSATPPEAAPAPSEPPADASSTPPVPAPAPAAVQSSSDVPPAPSAAPPASPQPDQSTPTTPTAPAQ